MADYAALSKKSYTLIAKHGMDCLLVRPAGTPDPVTGKVSSAGQTIYPAKCILKSYSAKEIDGTMIRLGDKAAIVAAYDLPEPATSDFLALSGKRWKIVSVKSIEPAGTAIIYNVQVRK